MYALVVGKGGSKLKEAVEEDAATPQGAAAPPPPPPGRDEAGPVRLKMDADGMPKPPSGMGRNGVFMMTMYGSGGLRTRMVCKGQPVSALLATLSSQLGRPVVDATNLKGKYDITLDYAPDGLNGSRIMMPPPPPQHDGRRWRARRTWAAPPSSPRCRSNSASSWNRGRVRWTCW